MAFSTRRNSSPVVGLAPILAQNRRNSGQPRKRGVHKLVQPVPYSAAGAVCARRYRLEVVWGSIFLGLGHV